VLSGRASYPAGLGQVLNSLSSGVPIAERVSHDIVKGVWGRIIEPLHEIIQIKCLVAGQ
jgi:hypothetical protein